MYELLHKDQPCKYRLFCDGETITVSLDARYRDYLVEAMPYYRALEEERPRWSHGLSAFEGGLEAPGRWGFGGALKILSNPSDDRILFHATIPVVQQQGLIEWSEAFHVAHSLEALFECMGRAEPLLTGNGLQSLYVMLVTSTSIHGGIIAANVSPAMVEWLVRAFDGDVQKAVEEVMLAVNHRMFPEWEHHVGVECHMRHETLQLKSGGSGSLGVIGCRKAEPGRGFELQPHNCDTPLDQLVLLAGLAKLDELFHKR